MKRDMRLIRQVLAATERGDRYRFLGYSEERVKYHVGLCKEAGWLKGRKVTWEGHNKLDECKQIEYVN